MVGPQNPAIAEAITDEGYGIVRKLPFRHSLYIAGVARSV